MARFTPWPRAISIARSTAARSPEITTCPPPLSLAGATTCWIVLPSSRVNGAACSQIVPACAISTPSSAAIAPAPAGTAACIASPRRRSRAAVALTGRLPAAASALYSPSEWPSTMTARSASLNPPSASSTRSTASDIAISAGWVFRVAVSSSDGPSNINLDSRCLSVSSTSWKTSRAGANAAARSRPMPTA